MSPSQALSFARWQAALSQAAYQALPARWRSTLAALEAARADHCRLRARAIIDARAVRKAAQCIRHLEELRGVLTHAMMNRG